MVGVLTKTTPQSPDLKGELWTLHRLSWLLRVGFPTRWGIRRCDTCHFLCVKKFLSSSAHVASVPVDDQCQVAGYMSYPV